MSKPLQYSMLQQHQDHYRVTLDNYNIKKLELKTCEAPAPTLNYLRVSFRFRRTFAKGILIYLYIEGNLLENEMEIKLVTCENSLVTKK